MTHIEATVGQSYGRGTDNGRRLQGVDSDNARAHKLYVSKECCNKENALSIRETKTSPIYTESSKRCPLSPSNSSLSSPRLVQDLNPGSSKAKQTTPGVPSRPSHLALNNGHKSPLHSPVQEPGQSPPPSSFPPSSKVSSCSLPTVSPSSPPEVTLRSRTVTNNSQQPGRLLNSAIARCFRNIHCNRGSTPHPQFPTTTSTNLLSSNLEQYISDIFQQLDSLHQGTVTREDFESLCEILGIDKTPVVSKRSSGLEWLSSYKPRSNSPASPLRVEKLGEVKYRGPKTPNKEPTSFLWTLGPRPFWELWPARKARRKHLTKAEFTENLLEQWAATHGYPGGEVPRILACHEDGDRGISTSPQVERVRGGQRTRRRGHLMERLARRAQSGGTNGHSYTNGVSNGHSCSNGASNGHRETNGVNKNPGTPNSNGQRNPNGMNKVYRITRTNISGEHPPPAPGRKLSGFFRSHQRKEQLEQHLATQQQEISSLKTVIQQLHGSLQLSDAQNLALQVMLKRVAKAESQQPSVENSQIRNSIHKSEKQLENLITELKEMSQTKYPTLSSQHPSSSSESNTGTVERSQEQNLGHTQEYLSGVQQELQGMASRLRQSPSVPRRDLSLTEAFDALVEAQSEIQKMR